MEEAVWAVIGDSVPYVAAILLAIYLITAVYIALLDGLRVDRWAIWSKTRGVMRGIKRADKESL